jgi:hypothetical protein
MKSEIKNPTTRKVRNRGFRPISYHHDSGIHNGWIYKVGTKWNHARFPSLGNVRISKADMRYVREL